MTLHRILGRGRGILALREDSRPRKAPRNKWPWPVLATEVRLRPSREG
jgi:hypothetical protein